MTEHARGRNERPQPDFFGKNRHQQAEVSRLKKSDRSDHGDDLDDPAAAAASCPPSRKRQRSRSRERARTGLWGDGQEQLPGRNGMVVASNRSSPLDPLPETPRSFSLPRSLASLSPPSKSAGGDSCDASSSDRPSLIAQEEEVARELGHREAFQSWRGHDDSLLSLMDEVMYDDDDDVLLGEKNDTHSSPHDWRLALERFRSACRVRSSSSSSGGDVLEEVDDSEVCYVPCDPVADVVPVAVDEEVDERQEEEDP